jgi:hypothetical protein
MDICGIMAQTPAPTYSVSSGNYRAGSNWHRFFIDRRFTDSIEESLDHPAAFEVT